MPRFMAFRFRGSTPDRAGGSWPTTGRAYPDRISWNYFEARFFRDPRVDPLCAPGGRRSLDIADRSQSLFGIARDFLCALYIPRRLLVFDRAKPLIQCASEPLELTRFGLGEIDRFAGI